ncbi:MFS transporter [Pseudogracilibacillus sp. SE30717A]|uniref:CynX/NimT family MFS transporter n=1 Tax=Pseudogracilibacillus sp. SE30717A TaxID=3098293 RepID=UPI00300E429B
MCIAEGVFILSEHNNRLYNALLIVGIIFVGINLRPAITSVGPLIGMIRADIHISNWIAGLLTSLPLIAFALMSISAAKIGRRFSNERSLCFGLAILACGIFIRSVSGIVLLLVGTFLIGFGIAICNVLLPSTIKEKFPTKVPFMTSLYSTTMGVFAATASGISIPLAKGIKLGWQQAMLVWSVPAILAMVVWLYISIKHVQSKKKTDIVSSIRDKRIWRSRLAWQVAMFLGFQSFLFYVTISWLPEILVSLGVDISTAGWLLAIAQFIGLPASFFAPIIAGKFKSQSGAVLITGLFAVVGYIGLLLSNNFVVIIICTMFIGITLSGGFALALSFLGLRAKNAEQAAMLSGMAQTMGYLLAAIGPFFIGFFYDLTSEWTIPLIILIIVSISAILFGMRSGKSGFILD